MENKQEERKQASKLFKTDLSKPSYSPFDATRLTENKNDTPKRVLGGRHRIIQMSPNDFFKWGAYHYRTTPEKLMEHRMNQVNTESVEKMRERMRAGEKYGIPYIRTVDTQEKGSRTMNPQWHEGFHRMLAAGQEYGMDTPQPVAVAYGKNRWKNLGKIPMDEFLKEYTAKGQKTNEILNRKKTEKDKAEHDAYIRDIADEYGVDVSEVDDAMIKRYEKDMTDLFDDEDEEQYTGQEAEWYKQFKSLGFSDDEIRDTYMPAARKSQAEEDDRARRRRDQEEWERKNAAKPRSSSASDMERIRTNAIKKFGLTNKFGDAFYMLPDGRMLSGSGKGRNGYGRAFDHRDIGGSYVDENIEIQEGDRGGNSHNMLDFMRGGNIRIIPESNSIDIMAKPTEAQMNMIYRLWKRGDIDNIQISNPNDKYGQQLGYLEDIGSEAVIANFMRKYYE